MWLYQIKKILFSYFFVVWKLLSKSRAPSLWMGDASVYFPNPAQHLNLTTTLLTINKQQILCPSSLVPSS